MTVDELIADYDREQKHADCDCNWCVMVAEVKRLRDELDSSDRRRDVVFMRGVRQGRAEADSALRETIRAMSENEGKLQLRIAQLETEARQLQNDVRVCQRGNMEMIGELKCHLAKLARVEALLPKWNREGCDPGSHENHMMDDLETALKAVPAERSAK